MAESSRARMLAAVLASQPEALPLPTVPQFDGDASVAKFTTVLEVIGGQVIHLANSADLAEVLTTLAGDYRVASTLGQATLTVGPDTPITTLASVELAILRGELGVAENGTVWLPEANMLHRALPTATQHLILVLDQRNLVATMHQAYARLQSPGGYGVFLAGPSKTADIEQSLVIGAHGSRSLTVVLL